MKSIEYCTYKTVIARYEPNVESGTGFIYNVDSGKMKTTNFLGFKIVRLLRTPHSLSALRDQLKLESIEVSDMTVASYIDRLIADEFVSQAT